MKHFGLLIICIGVGAIGWRIGGNLSSDAMGMAIGMLFGIMAGIPTALLLLASQRRRDDYDRPNQPPRRQIEQQPAPQVPQNIHIDHLHLHGPQTPQERPQMPQRAYRIIGSEHDTKI